MPKLVSFHDSTVINPFDDASNCHSMANPFDDDDDHRDETSVTLDETCSTTSSITMGGGSTAVAIASSSNIHILNHDTMSPLNSEDNKQQGESHWDGNLSSALLHVSFHGDVQGDVADDVRRHRNKTSNSNNSKYKYTTSGSRNLYKSTKDDRLETATSLVEMQNELSASFVCMVTKLAHMVDAQEQELRLLKHQIVQLQREKEIAVLEAWNAANAPSASKHYSSVTAGTSGFATVVTAHASTTGNNMHGSLSFGGFGLFRNHQRARNNNHSKHGMIQRPSTTPIPASSAQSTKLTTLGSLSSPSRSRFRPTQSEHCEAVLTAMGLKQAVYAENVHRIIQDLHDQFKQKEVEIAALWKKNKSIKDAATKDRKSQEREVRQLRDDLAQVRRQVAVETEAMMSSGSVIATSFEVQRKIKQRIAGGGNSSGTIRRAHSPPPSTLAKDVSAREMARFLTKVQSSCINNKITTSTGTLGLVPDDDTSATETSMDSDRFVI